jgi:hypothetical protein
MTYVSISDPVLNPITRVASAVETTYPIYGMIDNTSMVGLGRIYGDGLVKAGDSNIYFIGDTPFDPKQGDRIEFNGEVREVILLKAIYMGTVPVMWRALTRSGHRSGARSTVV